MDTLAALATLVFARARHGAARVTPLRLGALAWLLLSSSVLAAYGMEARSEPVFEANRGQTHEHVRFLARGDGYVAFFTPGAAVLALRGAGSERAVVRVEPVGTSAGAQIVAEGATAGEVHYGGSGAAAIRAPAYARVRYAGVYPGVDLVYYARGPHLEYDFVLAPGADPEQIALAFDGARRLAIGADGALIVHTAAGELRQRRPVVYQEIGGARRVIEGDYVVDGAGRVRFRLGAFDPTRALVIDPVLAYSTYLGGFGPEGAPAGSAGVAVDAAGNTYVTGTTESLDFPTTPGGDRTPAGGVDIFVTKLSPAGAVLYSTYLGTPCDDVARAIAIDGAGNAYVTGSVSQVNCYAGATPGMLVAKLGPTGAVVYATTFGGHLAGTSEGKAIAVDASGHAYVAGTTSAPDFPATPGAYRTERCADDVYFMSDGFVAKVSPDGASLVYATYLCGSADDAPLGIAVDAAGHAYVAGATGSHDFPTTAGALQPAFGPSGITGVTGFVSKLAPDGSGLVYSTFFGGSTRDILSGLALDGQGNVYVAGFTQSLDFPTTPGVLQERAPANLLNLICGYDLCYLGFVAKIGAGGAALVYSTYLYGEADHAIARIAVDAAGNAYVVGSTNSSYFPIASALQSANRGNNDVFVAKLNPDATRLVYSTYLGGSRAGSSSITGDDVGASLAVDAAGNAHVVGYTYSYDFPTTPGAFQRTLADGGPCDFYGTPCSDAFVAVIAAGGPGVTPPVRIAATPADAAPGGTVTATWAGLAPATDRDQIFLAALGAGRNDYFGYWETGSLAAGTLPLPLPEDLPAGSYELRLITPDASGVAAVIARSEPFRVAPPAADLVIAGVSTAPAQPMAGQAVAVTVTVSNQGAVAAGSFAVDFYKHLAGAPAPGALGDVHCTIASLAAGASAPCAGTVVYAASGSYAAWAQVDTGRAIAESNEGNNVSGPRAIAVVAAPDLAIVAVGNPPASAAPGKSFTLTDTVRNQGASTAPPSTTRFYLSLDGARDAGDVALTGSRSVPALAASAQSSGATTATVPPAIAAGTYRVLACADDLGAVAEASEANNCRASTGTVVVGLPDLVQTAVSNPPAAARAGTAFSVTDTVRNQGALAAGSSTTRYYLSADAQRSADDRLLTGSRTVPALAAGAASTQAVSLTIPAATPAGAYRVLACADDAKAVAESDEGNNCFASAGAVTVASPDLVQQSVSTGAGPFKRGTALTVADTAVNAALVATPRAATTRYYLSMDGVRSAGDVLLAGARTVPILAPSASSSGSVKATIPSGIAPGTYRLLACADDTGLIAESDEANNCRASAASVTVTP